jgi:hypothetical protein
MIKPLPFSARALPWLISLVAFLLAPAVAAAPDDRAPRPWALEPVGRPEVPTGVTSSPNPIDAFLGAGYEAKGLTPAGPADPLVLLRRVYLDLTGLPPAPADQEAFLRDPSPAAYERVVDRLLASEQHGVRYARHWLDVLRYADVDERMTAAPGIHLWRDWVIHALNNDLPYDQFVRAQLTGYRSTVRTQMSATGVRSRIDPRPDDQFALGFLARGDVIRDNANSRELAITAVETVSTAFMGMTVGCAKCHDHMYDPITQRDFYAMKALFDPLVPRKLILATPAEVFAAGQALDEAEARRAAIDEPLRALAAPYQNRLHDERVAMLPPEVQAVIRKPEKERSVAEQKIADDYFPVLRIDTGKLLEIMPAAERKKYQELQRQLEAAGGGQAGRGRRSAGLPVFWTVEVDPRRALEKSYILTSGDPDRPERDHEVTPGWPFAPAAIDFRDGRIEAFADWLTAPENPLFARVAVNRLWQWHFGEGLHRTPSDFGHLGGTPLYRPLLDWLASELVSRGFRMKALHRLIVTSESYKRASEIDPAVHAASLAADPGNTYIWHFRLRRLEAEPIWDAVQNAAGTLDLAVGGPSFDINLPTGRRGGGSRGIPPVENRTNRRAAYMIRGYSTSRDVVPGFLQAFDVDDGRAPCPVRTQTVTAPQALFLMNSDAIEQATARFGVRLKDESGGNLPGAVDLGFRVVLARPPSASERERALAYLENDPARLPGLAWLLFNMDEFLYVR